MASRRLDGFVPKRDLYAEVSARIIAELEAGAAPWIKPWAATPGPFAKWQPTLSTSDYRGRPEAVGRSGKWRS